MVTHTIPASSLSIAPSTLQLHIPSLPHVPVPHTENVPSIDSVPIHSASHLPNPSRGYIDPIISTTATNSACQLYKYVCTLQFHSYTIFFKLIWPLIFLLNYNYIIQCHPQQAQSFSSQTWLDPGQ